MKLLRPLIILDTETTGIDPDNDRIAELAAIKLCDNGKTEFLSERFNPERPIPHEASEIHGITDADVAGKPSFQRLSLVIADFFDGADLAGYNIRRFDLPIIEAEMKRAQINNMPWAQVNIVDVMDIFKECFPRTLEGAVKLLCGRDHANAHSAEGDVYGTLDVLLALVARFKLSESVADLAAIKPAGSENWVDRDGKLVWNEAGEVCVGFGKHEGRALAWMKQNESGYLRWILSNDFSAQVKDEIRKVTGSR